MHSSCLTKKLVIMLVSVSVFLGLISLGVSLPALAGFAKSGPKPRPRALIQNQIKNCKEKIDTSRQELAPGSCTYHPPSPLSPLRAEAPLFAQFPPQNNDRETADSRAPPRLSRRFVHPYSFNPVCG
jgi:hypothetical protein